MDDLFQVSVRRIQEWDLTKRERVLATWIVKLSYGHGRKSVWIPKLDYFVALTGFSRADVSDALRSLQEKGVLHIKGPSQGAKRYTFLPAAELVEPERVVDVVVLEGVLSAIEAANVTEDEPYGQLPLPHTVTADERLSADLAKGSRERALSSLDVPQDPAELHQRIAESLGVPLPVREAPLANRLRSGVGELPTLDQVFPARAATVQQYNSKEGATAPQCTVYCGGVAPKELLDRIERIVGPEDWAQGRQFRSLWVKSLQVRNGCAVRAAAEACAEMELKLRDGFKPRKTPGAVLWGIFQVIQRQMLTKSNAMPT